MGRTLNYLARSSSLSARRLSSNETWCLAGFGIASRSAIARSRRAKRSSSFALSGLLLGAGAIIIHRTIGTAECPTLPGHAFRKREREIKMQ